MLIAMFIEVKETFRYLGRQRRKDVETPSTPPKYKSKSTEWSLSSERDCSIERIPNLHYMLHDYLDSRGGPRETGHRCLAPLKYLHFYLFSALFTLCERKFVDQFMSLAALPLEKSCIRPYLTVPHNGTDNVKGRDGRGGMGKGNERKSRKARTNRP